MLERKLSRRVVSAWLLLATVVPAGATVPEADLSALAPETRSAIAAAREEATALGAAGAPASRAEAWGRLGTLYLHEAMLDAAEPCFRTASEAQPDQMRWSYYLAVVQQQRGNLQGAAENLRRALEVREGNLPVVLRLAGILAELGDAAKAEELYTAALQSPQGSAAGHAGLGRLALARRDATAAIASFENALAAQPEANALHHQLALAYAAAGDKARSREQEALAGPREVGWPDPLLAQLDFLSRSAPRPPGEDAQLGSLRRAVERSPGDAGARRALAQALIQTEDFAAAQEQYEEIFRRQQAEARDYLALGSLKADRQGDPTAGIADLEKALELDPQLYLAHQRLARMLMSSGKAEEAIAHWQRAIEIEPSLTLARLMLARALFGLERLPEAQAAIDELLRREPSELDGILMRGRIFAGRNQPEEARRDFERVAGATAAAPSQRAEAFFNLGLMHQASSDLESAIGDYRKAIEQDAAHVPALAALGPILAARGDAEGALPVYLRLASRQPDNLEVKYRLAALQMQAGDTAAARALFEELYRSQPAVPEFVVTSSSLLAELGEPDAGIGRIDQALLAQKEPQVRQRLLAARGRIEARAGRIDDAVLSYRQALKLGDRSELHLELAQALSVAARYGPALSEYEVYLKLRPQDENAQFARAMVLIWAGRWSEARDRLVEATAMSPNVELTHLLARLLASAPDAKVRNGERALQIAALVFEKERNPVHGETLALAMAAAGRFPEAQGLQQRLLAEAEQARFDAAFIERVKGNLARFEKGEIGVSNW